MPEIQRFYALLPLEPVSDDQNLAIDKAQPVTPL
jgi:hypothetical protein